MGMYLIAPPIAFLVVALVPAVVMGIASRMARRADWLEARAAEAAEAQTASDGAEAPTE